MNTSTSLQRHAPKARSTPLPTTESTDAADQRLRAHVLDRLSQTALRHLGIQIQVQDGLVRLCGSLRDARLRAHAEWLVFTTDGVQAVCSDWHTAASSPQRSSTSPH